MNHTVQELNARISELEAALQRLIDRAQEATEADEPVEFAHIDDARKSLAKAR